MELRHPPLILIIFILITLYLIFSKKEQAKYKEGSKIANTSYIKNSEYYQNKVNKYKKITKIIKISFCLAILSSTILLARLTKVENINQDEYNRDIILCLDVSASVDDLNIELVENLKKTVNSLNGERFGISIFNSSSVTLSPLTTDYNYINSILEQIKKSIEVNSPLTYNIDYDDTSYLYNTNYIRSGTLEENLQRGSSLIGDGLASCIYNFSNLEEKRTRIIIFSTDNDLAGTPLLSLDKAAELSKSKDIKIFGIGTKLMKSQDKNSFKNAIEKTNGKFYEHSTSTVNNIVNDIEKTSKSLLKRQKETKKVDIPLIPFIILLISITLIIIIDKKVIQ